MCCTGLKLNQNWNFMCSECHSTGVKKNYDAANDSFATSFAEISVGLRSLPWSGLPPCRMGARQSATGGHSEKSTTRTMGLAERFSERRDAIVEYQMPQPAM